jgi:hypothetical protein
MQYLLPLLRRCFTAVRLVLVKDHRNMLHYSDIES